MVVSGMHRLWLTLGNTRSATIADDGRAVAAEDMWDTPRGIGNFSADGVFGKGPDAASQSAAHGAGTFLAKISTSPGKAAGHGVSEESRPDGKPLFADPEDLDPNAAGPGSQNLAANRRMPDLWNPTQSQPASKYANLFDQPWIKGAKPEADRLAAASTPAPAPAPAPANYLNLLQPSWAGTTPGAGAAADPGLGAAGSPAVAVGPDPGGISASFTSSLTLESRHTPVLGNSAVNSPRSVGSKPEPPASLTPPVVAATFAPTAWQYKDPNGNVQGPFSVMEMHTWYRGGYFDLHLPVKRVTDHGWELLSTIIQVYGHEAPFFVELEEAERLFHMSRQQQMLRQQYQPYGAGADPFNPLVNDPGYGSYGGYRGPSALMGGMPYGAAATGMGGRYPLFGNPNDSIPINTGYGWADPSAALNPLWPGGRADANSYLHLGVAGGHPLQSHFANTPQQFYNETREPVPSAAPEPKPTAPVNPSFAEPIQPPVPAGPIQQRFAAQVAPGPAEPAEPAEPEATQEEAAASQIDEAAPEEPVVFEQHERGHEDEYEPEHELETEPEPVVVQETAKPRSRSSSLVKRNRSKSPAKSIQGEAPEVAIPAPAPVPTAPISKSKKKKEERLAKKASMQLNASSPLSPNAAPASPAPASPAAQTTPAVDLRQIIQEQEALHKKELEERLAQQKQRETKEREERQREPQAKASAPLAWATAEKPKLSLKEIQEKEQQEHEARAREQARLAEQMIIQQAQQLQYQEQQEQAYQSIFGASNTSGGKGWGVVPRSVSSAAKQSKTLADIMQEEEQERQREMERKSQSGEQSLGRRYTATAAAGTTTTSIFSATTTTTTTTVASSGVAWGGAAAAAKTVPFPKVASPATLAASVKPATAASNTSSPASSDTKGWNVVGVKASPITRSNTAPAATVSVATKIASSVQVPKTSPSQVAPASTGPRNNKNEFLQWCRSALRPLDSSTTAGVNVEDFVQILLSIPTNETATVVSICDDTLGGLTAIDPRKFAEEFQRRRKIEQASGALADSAGWNTVGVSANNQGVTLGGPANLEGFDTGNKFVVVGKSKKSKGKKK
ncbi:uncharacterized protein BJ171DRAFT_118358 [Polychytrium aggregatum]|uniref:uncharacterized protein n=1 Tax=Polychytrium aggregatum TaxID=110093 RepID=UPI0022FEDD49|nr:uncharacterized protein BJ171DRAFT_118358 [Polychytrium aggregatum]KAI9209481.1 hypothetical protein BJ171DRAFT_118358 [Polychytrium aggregatum]